MIKVENFNKHFNKLFFLSNSSQNSLNGEEQKNGEGNCYIKKYNI